MDYSAYLLGLPLSQFKAVRKAIFVLVRCGISREEATQIIVAAHAGKSRRYENYAATQR